MSTQDLLTFPCEFPLKVLGRTGDEFRAHARGIVERHVGVLESSRISERLSRDANFLALTFTIPAQSREQLDALYRELTASETIVMVL
jgi:putative lipoic acid-binding regulatory protein